MKRVEGNIEWLQSEREDCLCCDGKHVYGRDIRLDDGERLDVTMWVWRALRELPEGARVSLTLERVT